MEKNLPPPQHSFFVLRQVLKELLKSLAAIKRKAPLSPAGHTLQKEVPQAQP